MTTGNASICEYCDTRQLLRHYSLPYFAGWIHCDIRALWLAIAARNNRIFGRNERNVECRAEQLVHFECSQQRHTDAQASKAFQDLQLQMCSHSRPLVPSLLEIFLTEYLTI